MKHGVYIAVVLWLCAAIVGAWRYADMPMTRCAWCGSTGSLLNPLQRHHILPQERFPSLKDEPTNLIVLCHRDHIALGHRGNTRQYNPDVRTICETFTNCLRNTYDAQ